MAAQLLPRVSSPWLLLSALLVSDISHSAHRWLLERRRRRRRRRRRKETPGEGGWKGKAAPGFQHYRQIPSSFSIHLVHDPSEVWLSKNRRLLNTEKIIFKADSSKPVYVLVTVEPEGVVAKPNVPERELVIFNIVCDELMLGIPHFAWWVGVAAFLCVVIALLAPCILPLDKLFDYGCTGPSSGNDDKLF